MVQNTCGYKNQSRSGSKVLLPLSYCTFFLQNVFSFGAGKRFQLRVIKEISFPPASSAGRGGAIREKGGTMDFGILAIYSLPLSARRKVQLKASRQLLDWMRIRLSSWPGRVFTLAAGDLNSSVGRSRDGTYADGPSVGESHLTAQNKAGDDFVEMAVSLELGILNTILRPTYCGLAGLRSTNDYVLGAAVQLVLHNRRSSLAGRLDVSSS